MHSKPGVCCEESCCLGQSTAAAAGRLRSGAWRCAVRAVLGFELSAVLGAILGAVLGEARPLEEPSQRRAGRLDELVQRHDEHLARAIKGGHQW